MRTFRQESVKWCRKDPHYFHLCLQWLGFCNSSLKDTSSAETTSLKWMCYLQTSLQSKDSHMLLMLVHRLLKVWMGLWQLQRLLLSNWSDCTVKVESKTDHRSCRNTFVRQCKRFGLWSLLSTKFFQPTYLPPISLMRVQVNSVSHRMLPFKVSRLGLQQPAKCSSHSSVNEAKTVVIGNSSLMLGYKRISRERKNSSICSASSIATLLTLYEFLWLNLTQRLVAKVQSIHL